MDLTSAELGQLIVGMRAEYANGNNVMAYARNVLGKTIGGGGEITDLQLYLPTICRPVHMLKSQRIIQISISNGVSS